MTDNGTSGILLTTAGGLIIAIVGALITRWQKKRKPPPPTPAESAANINLINLQTMLDRDRANFQQYREETERSETDFRRQVNVELREMRNRIDWQENVINILDDEVIDLRDGVDSGRYPPFPPRRPRPPRPSSGL